MSRMMGASKPCTALTVMLYTHGQLKSTLNSILDVFLEFNLRAHLRRGDVQVQPQAAAHQSRHACCRRLYLQQQHKSLTISALTVYSLRWHGSHSLNRATISTSLQQLTGIHD